MLRHQKQPAYCHTPKWAAACTRAIPTMRLEPKPMQPCYVLPEPVGMTSLQYSKALAVQTIRRKDVHVEKILNEMFMKIIGKSACCILHHHWPRLSEHIPINPAFQAQSLLAIQDWSSKKNQAPTNRGLQNHQQRHWWRKNEVNVVEMYSLFLRSRSNKNCRICIGYKALSLLKVNDKPSYTTNKPQSHTSSSSPATFNLPT